MSTWYLKLAHGHSLPIRYLLITLPLDVTSASRRTQMQHNTMECDLCAQSLGTNRQYLVDSATSRAPHYSLINRLTPNDPYMGRTASLTSKHCILYIYSTNTGTEYFKHALHSPFFSLQNAVCFIMLICLVPVLFTFYIQCVLKLKK